MHAVYKDKIHDFVRGHFYGYVIDANQQMANDLEVRSFPRFMT